MKVTALEGFYKALSDEVRAIAILAKEPADREAALARVGHGGTTLCAESATPQLVAQELESQSLFGESGPLIIKTLEKIKKPLLDLLAEVVMRPGRRLILVGEKLNGSTRLYKRLVETGLLLDMPELKQWELEKQIPIWVVQEMKKQGKTLAAQAGLLLVQQIGTDKTRLQRELEKLACYLGERPEATVDDVRAICGVNSTVNAWDVSAELFKGSVGRAMEIGRELLAHGTAMPALLRLLRNQIATDLQVWCIMSSGGSAQEVTQEFRYMRGRILDEHLNNARTFGGKRLRRALVLIDQTDLKSKNSQVADAVLLDRLLASL